MAKLVLCASLWSLASYPRPEKEWSLERKLREIRGAGIKSVSGAPAAGLSALARRAGLRRLAAFIAPDGERLKEGLDLCALEKPERINIQIGTPDQSPREALRLLIQARREAARHGLKISFESHRGTALETPDKLEVLAGGYEESTGERLPVTWDFSHHAVVRQLPAGNWAKTLLEERGLVSASAWFHLRPHSAHHVQVPVMGRNGPSAETVNWLPFAREALRVWRNSPGNAGCELFVTPELGPRGEYGLAAAPPIWPEVLALSALIRKEWKAAGKG